MSRSFSTRFHPMLAVALALSLLAAGKPKPKPGPAPAKPAPGAGAELPKDLNLASMRLHAVDTLYELDLSSEQLKALKESATGTASEQKRTAAAGDEKLAAAMTDFYRALLAREDDQDIARLRNKLAEMSADDTVKLDDEVEPTDTAREKAPAVCKRFSAGQIAAFLASHADQIADPDEKMVGLLEELHDTTSASEADALVKDASEEIGRLVGGADQKKSSAMTAQVAEWFKAKRELTDDQIEEQHDALLASAKKVIGDVPPMEILGHWMEEETAVLLSNPQLSEAIEAALAAEEQDK
jgi:hypothetical protein